MSNVIVKVFKTGLVTRIEKQSVKRGGSSDCMGWHFLGDRIELSRGSVVMGTEVTGTGKITGLKVGQKFDGIQIPFFTYGRKIKYYDVVTEDNIEIGSDYLPLGADGEEISMTPVYSLGGAFVYLSSPNSSIYKIAVANPGNITDLLSPTYRGFIRAKQSRIFLWNRKDSTGGSDKTGLYLSKIDRQSLASYTFVSAEDLATGDGSTSAYSGTLAFKASNSKATASFVVIAGGVVAATSISSITQAPGPLVTSNSHGLSVGDKVVIDGVVGMTEINKRIGVVLTVPSVNTFTVDINSSSFTAYSSGGTVSKSEIFTDNRSGVLNGNLGGTGAINYTTGAYTVNFSSNVVNAQHVVAQYYTEDATNGGIADFSYTIPTRLAGEGATFRQDDGGADFQNLFSLGGVEYCLHKLKSWALTMTQVDTAATNLIYRNRVGIENWQGGVETGDGIYYIDSTDKLNPTVRLLNYSLYSTEVLPSSISDQLDLSGYSFDQAVMFEFGQYICLACRTSNETVNNRLFMYHRVWKSWEVHSFRGSFFDLYNGALLAGDSGSNNIFKLFSGLANGETPIENWFVTNDDDCDLDGVKVNNRLMVGGDIDTAQELEIYYSTDNEDFVYVTTILGTGTYVDLSQSKVVGNKTLGEEQVGGGAENYIFASPYKYEFFAGTKKFDRIRLKFVAKKIGYVSVSEYGMIDIRGKGKSSPAKYIAS